MKNMVRTFVAFVLCGLVTGCAGFARVPDDKLVLGQTRSEQITDLLGSPQRQGEFTRNNEVMNIYTYAYATQWIHGDIPYTDSVRLHTFFFHNDKLVGHAFASSFKEDSTNFDETKVSQIVRGESTRSDVVRLIGNPGGKAMYPAIPNKNETAVIYSHHKHERGVFKFKVYDKRLAVSFNEQGVVTSVEFSESGEK